MKGVAFSFTLLNSVSFKADVASLARINLIKEPIGSDYLSNA